MLRRSTFTLAFAVAAIVALSTRVARAQTTTTTTTTSGPTIMFTGEIYPSRIQNGQNIGTGPRPANLTPLGINYQDCISDQTLQFSLTLDGFSGQQVQAWASTNSDCTQDSYRNTIGSIGCWLVGSSQAGLNYGIATTIQINVRVQDIVGWQQSPPTDPSYHPLGVSACNSQPSFTGVPFTLYFIAVSGLTNESGAGAQYTLQTDLMGPPAPVGNASIGDGDTLFVVNWAPNADSDTVGYDLFIDPPIGSEPDASSSAMTPVLVCDDGGTSGATTVSAANVSLDGGGDGGESDAASIDDAAGGGAGDGAASDASADATVATSTDAGPSCHLAYVAGSSPSSSKAGTCNDSNLTAGITQDASTEVVVEDDSGLDDLDGETTPTDEGAGGISEIDPKYMVPAPNNAGLDVSGEATSSHTITGLQNGTTYTVVVSAVDGFGNIGPPSGEACDYPAPVNDFWKVYRDDGGGAGGFCALEAVGAPVGSTMGLGAAGVFLVGLVRRRRRRR